MRNVLLAILVAAVWCAGTGGAAAEWKTQTGIGTHTKKRYGVVYSITYFGFMTVDLSEIAIYCYKDNPMFATLAWDLEDVADPNFLTGEVEIDIDGYDKVRTTLEKRHRKKTGFTMTVPAKSRMMSSFLGAMLEGKRARIRAFTKGGNDTDWSTHKLDGFHATFKEACSWHADYKTFVR